MPAPLVAVPDSEEALTPEWFTVALRGSASGARVRDVVLERQGGLASLTFRARLSYDASAGGKGPESVVVKLAAVPRFGELGLEVRFYEEIAPLLPVEVPAVHFAQVDREGGRLVLLLEDLMLRDRVAPFTSADLGLAVDSMAAMHARFWGSPELDRFTHLRSIANFIERVEGRLQTGLLSLLEQFGDWLNAETKALLERLSAGFRHAAEPLARAPRTLAHHDLSRRNLFVESDANGVRRLLYIDWQVVQAVPGVRDLSFLIENEGGGLSIDDERALLRRYHASLLKFGVGGYSYDRLEQDYRRSIICDFGRIVMTSSNPNLGEGMHAINAEQLHNRASSVERWGLLELL
jgi:hypothetical protein